jgi:hypothetical protein
MRLVRLLLLVLAMFAPTQRATADSWAAPSAQLVESSDRHFRLFITPRAIVNQLAYFSDKVDGRSLAGQAANAASAPRGRLERRSSNGEWVVVWDRELLNDVSPVTATISSVGAVATFDDWHMVGTGDHAVVIYSPAGEVVRSFKLQEILPSYYIRALPASVSSIVWGGSHAFTGDGQALVLQVLIPERDPDLRQRKEKKYAALPISASTGELLLIGDDGWSGALAEAQAAFTALEAREAAREAAFRAPLSPPSTKDTAPWHAYLREVFYRQDPDWREGFAGVSVIPDPDQVSRGPSIEHLRKSLTDYRHQGGVLMLASPMGEDHFVAPLERITANMKPDALAGDRVYVFGHQQIVDRSRAILEPLGAQVFQIDPDKAIPQRIERLAMMDAAKSAPQSTTDE